MGIRRSSASDVYRHPESLFLVRREVLYNILIKFGIPMNLVRLIKMCLKLTYSSVWVGKNLSNMFPIRNGLKQEILYRHCFSTLL
jgi:hypothetical protein